MTSVLASPTSTLPPVPAFQQPLESLPNLNGDSANLDHNPSATSQPTTHTAADNVPRGPVSATLNFYKPAPNNEKPWNYVEIPKDGPQRNYGEDDHQIHLQDARGNEDSFHLDKAAFALLKNYPHNDKINWDSDESIKSVFYPEVEQLLLKELPGSPNRVLLFDHTIRRANPNAHRAPVTRAHIDQTAKSAKQRVEFHLPDEAETLLKCRYRIVNVWRPITGPVESFPLAFADSATVEDDDMVPVEHRYPTRTGETAAIKYNKEHKWHYWSGMDTDERILLQCFDSEKPNNRVPHSAFVDPRSTEMSRPRESIEVRALVFG